MEFKEQLTFAIADAVRNILPELYASGEHFYYITLVAIEEPTAFCLSAWSKEALDKVDPEDAPYVKWSYADSPYNCIGQEHFSAVQAMLDERSLYDMDDDAFDAECELRLSAMETAMRLLDSEGLFAKNQPRDSVLVAAEIMPPDASNTERVSRLNDQKTAIFREWLEEAAETE